MIMHESTHVTYDNILTWLGSSGVYTGLLHLFC